jgi:pimeloyl-ACP methyl ester carboxylesterase
MNLSVVILGMFLFIAGFFTVGCATNSLAEDKDSARRYTSGERENSAKVPILLIHGRGMDSSSFSKMIRFLQERGYPREFLKAIDLKPSDGPNIPAAEKQIAPAVEIFLREVNQSTHAQKEKMPITKIDIIAHSMGSLSTRWYCAKLRPDRVDTWISLAGPNHGSNVGCPGRRGSGKEEQCPAFAKSAEESFIQFALNGHTGPDVDETPFGLAGDSEGVLRVHPDALRRILYITVRTLRDVWIEPIKSTMVDGAGGVEILTPEILPVVETSSGNFLMLNGVTHDELVFNEEVFELIFSVLSRNRY